MLGSPGHALLRARSAELAVLAGLNTTGVDLGEDLTQGIAPRPRFIPAGCFPSPLVPPRLPPRNRDPGRVVLVSRRAELQVLLPLSPLMGLQVPLGGGVSGGIFEPVPIWRARRFLCVLRRCKPGESKDPKVG